MSEQFETYPYLQQPNPVAVDLDTIQEQAPASMVFDLSTINQYRRIPANIEEQQLQLAKLQSEHTGEDVRLSLEKIKALTEYDGFEAARQQIADAELASKRRAADEGLKELISSGASTEEIMQFHNELYKQAKEKDYYTAVEQAHDVLASVTGGEWSPFQIGEAENLAARNTIASIISQEADEAGVWDWLGVMFGNWSYWSNWQEAKTIEKATGGAVQYSAKDILYASDLKEKLRNYYEGLDFGKKKDFIQTFYKVAKEQSSTFSDKNALEVADRLGALLEATPTEDKLDTAFMAVDTFLLGLSGKALFNFSRASAKVAKVGAPAAVAARASMDKQAAELVISDLLTGSKTSGLSRAEQIASAVSHASGKELAETFQTFGIKKEVQQFLEGASQKVLDLYQGRLRPTILTEEQLIKGMEPITEVYKASPAIRAVDFPEDFATAGRVEVTYGTSTGARFLSEEAAQTVAEAKRLQSYKIVEEALEVPAARPTAYAEIMQEKVVKTKEEAAKIIERLEKAEKVSLKDFAKKQGYPPKEFAKAPPEIKAAIEEQYKKEVTLTPQKKVALEHKLAKLEAKLPEMEKAGLQTKKVTRGYVIKSYETPIIPSQLYGKLTQPVKGTVAISPRFAIAEENLVPSVIAGHLEEGVALAFDHLVRDSISSLSKKEVEQIFNVLEQGSTLTIRGQKTGKVFDSVELEALGLTSLKQQKAYYGIRMFRDLMFGMRDATVTDTLVSQGFHRLVSKDGKDIFGRVLAPDAGQGVAFDVRSGKQAVVNEEFLKKNAGVVIYEMHPQAKFKTPTGEYTRIVANPDSFLQQKITHALPYRDGDFSRIFSDDYFIYAKVNTMVDGELKEVIRHIRTANTESKATKWVLAHNEALKLFRSGGATQDIAIQMEKLIGEWTPFDEFADDIMKNGDIVDFGFHYNRSQEDTVNNLVNIGATTGRTFFTSRGEYLPSITKERNVLDPMSSIAIEATNVSRFVAVEDWKRGAISRFLNTFEDVLPLKRTGRDEEDFFKTASAGLKGDPGSSQFRWAKRELDAILARLNVQSVEEKIAAGRNRKIAESIEKITEDYAPSWAKGKVESFWETQGWKIRRLNPVEFIRHINYNLTLGMWAVDQVFVQAMGAVSAGILHPVYGSKAVATYHPLRIALMSDNPDVWKRLGQAAEKMKLPGVTADDFVDLVTTIRNSGLIANTQSSALYGTERGTFNIYHSYWHYIKQGSTLPFRVGEEFSRLVTFDVSRRLWMEKNLGRNWKSQEALQQIIKYQDDLTANMTRASAANWQKDIRSIPLQFWQWPLKFNEHLIRGVLGQNTAFTRKDALAIMAGMAVLFGARGTGTQPVLNWLQQAGIFETFGLDVASMTEEEKTYLGEGLFAGLLYSTSNWASEEGGASVGIGTRLGPGNIATTIFDSLMEKNTLEAFLGATMGTIKRASSAFHKVYDDFSTDPNVEGRDVVRGLLTLSTVARSVDNMVKAQWYKDNEQTLMTSTMKPIDKMTNLEIVFRRLGFQPSIYFDRIASENVEKEYWDDINKQSQIIVRLIKEKTIAEKRGDEARVQDLKAALNVAWSDKERNPKAYMDQVRVVKKLLSADQQYRESVTNLIERDLQQPFTITGVEE